MSLLKPSKETGWSTLSNQEETTISFEVAQYLAMPGIYQINVPADKRKRWTYKERLDFVELVFVASARYKTHHMESNLRSPKSLCAGAHERQS